MQVTLSRPDLEQFIADEVGAGRYPSPQHAIEAAVEQMMADQRVSRLTEEDAEAIKEADAQIERGEYVELDAFISEMRKRYVGR